MIIGKGQPAQLMQLINQNKGYLKTIREYVPFANVGEIYIVKDLINFLTQTNESGAYDAIVKSSDYFKKAIGYAQAYNPTFDENKLILLVQTVFANTIKQKQMSVGELLDVLRRSNELIENQERKNKNLSRKILDLLDLEKSTLLSAKDTAKLTAGHAKAKYQKVADVISNITKSYDTRFAVNIDVDLLRKLVLSNLDAEDLGNLLAQQLVRQEFTL